MVAIAAEALMAGKTAGEVGLLLGPLTEFGACGTRHDGSLVTSKLIHNESFFNEGLLVCETDTSGPTITLYLSPGEWGRQTPISTCHLCWHHDLLDLKNRMNFG
ncbi:uncharacterized protein LOC131218737 [Magnolia sinica]|uniref:uncharacterized protein LOC131218737 n=1 Tax=Magnolia sinica TaxID=86752 RepID=UPI00265A7252|nr:uncharacterized protein LOC131218737 [Magnolia sinica]